MKVEGISSYKNISSNVRFQGNNVSMTLPETKNLAENTSNNIIANYNKIGQNKPFGTISFRGKDMIKGQYLSVVAEMPPYAKKGGVASVAESYNQINNYDVKLVTVMPGYNAELLYNEKNEFNGDYRVPKAMVNGKEEYVYTGVDLRKKTIQEVVDSKKGFWILDEVVKQKNISIGLDDNVPVSVFKVRGTKHYMVFTPQTAAMHEPYEKGPYLYASETRPVTSAWKASPYGEYQRALVSLLPDMVADGVAPEKIILSDPQTACIPELMAKELNKGAEYYKDLDSYYISHNAGAGYVGYLDGRAMLVDCGVTKQEIEKIMADPEYLKACEKGDPKEYFKKIIGAAYDEASDSFSPSTVALKHAQSGNLANVATVSENYAKEIMDSDISPTLKKIFTELAEKCKARGILNPSEDPSLDPFSSKGLMPGYSDIIMEDNGKTFALTEETVNGKTVFKYKDAVMDGETVLHEKGSVAQVKDKTIWMPFKSFRQSTEDAPLTLAELVKSKSYNQARLLERLANDGKKIPDLILSGMSTKQASLIGGIDQKFVKQADDFAKGVADAKPLNLWCAWGRVDNQKGIPITLSAFEKYMQRTHDKDAILVLGGELSKSESKEEVAVVKEVLDRMLKNPELKGRVVYFDGFAPGKIFASATNNTIFTSRFEPCGLTNVETMKYLGTPYVTNTGGFGQLADLGFGKATKHGWFLTEETLNNIKNGFIFDNAESIKETYKEFGILDNEAYKTADDVLKQQSDGMKDVFEAFGKECKNIYETNLSTFKKRLFIGAQPSVEKLENFAKEALYKDKAYEKLEKQLRDNILIEEFTQLISDAGKMTEEAKIKNYNHIQTLNMAWTGSEGVHPNKKSTLENYREFFAGKVVNDKYSVVDLSKVGEPKATSQAVSVSVTLDSATVDAFKSSASTAEKTAKTINTLSATVNKAVQSLQKTNYGVIIGGAALALAGIAYAYKNAGSQQVIIQNTSKPVSKSNKTDVKQFFPNIK